MGLCQMLTKGYSMSRGKNSSYCVAVEYTSQANPANPHFFRFPPPPLDIFWRVMYNYFSTLFILVFGRSYDLKNLLKFIITLLRKIEKILHSGCQKIFTGGVRAFAPLTAINEAKPFCYLIFPLLAKPSSSWKCE